RTVKRYYEAGLKGDLDKLRERKPSVPPLLHGFEEIIRDKLELNCSAASIFYFWGIANISEILYVKERLKYARFYATS
ncbi:hypothetical protein ACTFAI_003049, partial [Listeria monocytogenes]